MCVMYMCIVRYEIFTNGPSAIDEAEVMISWPLYVNSDVDEYLLYIYNDLEISQTNGMFLMFAVSWVAHNFICYHINLRKCKAVFFSLASCQFHHINFSLDSEVSCDLMNGTKFMLHTNIIAVVHSVSVAIYICSVLCYFILFYCSWDKSEV